MGYIIPSSCYVLFIIIDTPPALAVRSVKQHHVVLEKEAEEAPFERGMFY